MAVRYLDKSGDSQKLSQLIKNVLASQKLQQQMSQAGIAQAKKFSWQKTASKTIAILNQL